MPEDRSEIARGRRAGASGLNRVGAHGLAVLAVGIRDRLDFREHRRLSPQDFLYDAAERERTRRAYPHEHDDNEQPKHERVLKFHILPTAFAGGPGC